MLREIDFRTKDGALSSTLTVCGDSEKVTIVLSRGGHYKEINKRCGIWETIHDSFLYPGIGLQGTSESQIQRYFEDRIEHVIKILSSYGRHYVHEDEQNVISIQENKKTSKERTEELEKFVSKVVERIEKR